MNMKARSSRLGAEQENGEDGPVHRAGDTDPRAQETPVHGNT